MHPFVEHVRLALIPDTNVELKLRFYQAVCLLAALSCLLVIVPSNLAQDLPAIVTVGAATLGLLSLALWILGRRGRYYPGALLAGVVGALVVGWFPNAGSMGSLPFYFFTALAFPLVFFEGRRRWLFAAGTVVVGLSLFGVEFAMPSLLTPFATPDDRAIDLLTGFVISCAIVVSFIAVIVSGYRHERERLTVTLSALERSMAEAVEAREAVAESRSLLSALIDNTQDPVWLVAPDTFELKLWNEAFARVLAATRDTRPGGDEQPRPGFDGVPPAIAAWWKEQLRRAVEVGPFAVEYAMPGTDRSFLASLNPVRHEGELIGVSVFAKEITKLKQAERERDAIVQQLLESQKMESLGSLAGGVAHDYNNMLAGIMGYAEVLLQEESEPARRQHLKAILQAAGRSSDLTKKLLAFARRGKNVVEAVSLNALATDCIEILRPTFRADTAVHLDLQAQGTVDADPSQMNQLLVNLCVNASEAMPDGGSLTVRTRDVSLDAAAARKLGLNPGPGVVLEVADTGVGMSEEIKSHIFEPFFTTKTDSDQGGTGLGLATVYGIVQLHNGAIEVASSPGRGTTFTIVWPKGRIAPRVPVAAHVPQGGSGLMLVADDELLLRRLATTALTRLGYEVLTAGDGEEAVQLFRDRHQELTGVILDLKMPRMGGAEAFGMLRTIDPSVPVLICSGYGDNEEAQGLISQGARGLLPKPFSLAQLSSQIERLRRPATAGFATTVSDISGEP